MNILIVGDALSDHYLVGHIERTSPEDKNVPVVEVDKEAWCPGGCLNVAANLASLSDGAASITLATALSDTTLSILEDQFQLHVSPFVLAISDHDEITKTRVIANGQQLVRADSRKRFSDDVIQRFGKRFASVRPFYHMPYYDAVVVSDYSKGLVTPEVIKYLESGDVPVFVDTKNPDLAIWRNIKKPILKLNGEEFARCRWADSVKDIIVTQSQFPTQRYLGGKHVSTHPVPEVKASNVIGAGDVFLAGLVLSYLRSGDLNDAIGYGHRVAQIAVQRPLAETPVVSDKDLAQ
jgi:bifunctional ADP-heptose synthase (sugar kinase/adenylyltransferase)